MSDDNTGREGVTHYCPFPDCEWSHDYPGEEVIDDAPTVRHYEREHGGQIRVQVTVEYERTIGEQTPRDIRESALERWQERGHDVAHVRTEVLDEADDHSQLDQENPQ